MFLWIGLYLWNSGQVEYCAFSDKRLGCSESTQGCKILRAVLQTSKFAQEKKKMILFSDHEAMYSCGRINKKEMYPSSHLATLGPSQQGNLPILYLMKEGVIEHGLCYLWNTAYWPGRMGIYLFCSVGMVCSCQKSFRPCLVICMNLPTTRKALRLDTENKNLTFFFFFFLQEEAGGCKMQTSEYIC